MSSLPAVLRRLHPPADAGTLTAYARTRDPLLLAELVRRHGGLVWGVCRRTLPHRPDAEDAYQATWLVLASNPGAVRTPAALPGFLHAVAVRTSRRVRQKRPLTADGTHLPAPEPADREGLAALDAELATLPERLRQPLVLCYLDGHTQDEAATALGLSLSTLKRRLETGKELLRVRLAGRGVDVAAVLAAASLTGVGAPAVVAGGAGFGATALSTEVLTAMWMLKAKTWVACAVLATGVTAAGGGLMLAGGQGPGGGPAPAAKPVDPPAAANRVASIPAGPLPVDGAAHRRELEWLVRELERAIPAAEETLAIQQRTVDAGGYPANERVANLTLLAQYRDAVTQHRVELAKVKVEIAKLQSAGNLAPLVPPAPAVPARLLKERIDTARQYVRLDQEIRNVGAISKEEASAFEMNLRLTNQSLYEAVRASDPSPAGQLAAAREWYVNTRDAEAFYQGRSERGLSREQVGLAAKLARNQAEAALLQATAAAPPAARDRLAPFAGAAHGFAGRVTEVLPVWIGIRPAAGLKPLTAVRVSRAGKPVGVLVVTLVPDAQADANAEPERRGMAAGVMLPNADGTVPVVQIGDEVRP